MLEPPKTDAHLERITDAIRTVQELMQLHRNDSPNYAPVLLRLKQERDKYQIAIA